MPTYEYKCERCGRFDYFQPITADPLKTCPTCNGPVERLISVNGNIIFKGSGWHITDYRSKSYNEQAKKEKDADSSAKSETKAAASSSDTSS